MALVVENMLILENLKYGRHAHLTDGVDVDVVLRVGRMGHERLDQEAAESSLDGLDLLGDEGAVVDPLPGLGPGLVEGQKATLSSPLDQLVRLGHEAGAGGEEPRVGGLGSVEDGLDVVAVVEVDRRQLRGRVVFCRGREGRRLDDGCPGEVVVEDGLAIGLED